MSKPFRFRVAPRPGNAYGMPRSPRVLAAVVAALLALAGTVQGQTDLQVTPGDDAPQPLMTGSCGPNTARYGGAVRITDREDRLICSGVMISDRLVLTSAHCFDGRPDRHTGQYRIHTQRPGSVVGPTCITRSTRQGNFGACTDRRFAVVKHPGYAAGRHTGDDIALMGIVDNRLQYADGGRIPNAHMARLFDDSYTKSGRQLISGFGPCNERGAGAGTYRHAAIDVSRWSQRHYRHRVGLSKRICKGDSGGPAFLRHGRNDLPIVVGLAANFSRLSTASPRCTPVTFAQRFTKISTSAAWISAQARAMTGTGCRRPHDNPTSVNYLICFD